MSAVQWLESGIFLWLGASLLITFGILFSLLNDIQKTSALANIVTIGLAVLGGLWFPINTFPNWLQHVAHVLPSYHLKMKAKHCLEIIISINIICDNTYALGEYNNNILY